MDTAMPAAHSMNMGNGCKISMLWNWNVLDTCFMTSSWHIHSTTTFSISCVGTVLLTILLEFLRRAGKEYDRFIVAQHDRNNDGAGETMVLASSDTNARTKNPRLTTTAATAVGICGTRTKTTMSAAGVYRPSVVQQAIRALLHTCQFAVAYIVMLMAMYYNGYIILCIFLGAYIGNFIFGWESFKVGIKGEDRMQENITVCCG
ncbi:Ctr copper transporter [Pyrenophora teres f. teres]|uniref:Copper transport protein n=1 Tax=Pyrenophora teres f. teres TaxID=97479 RepID=A0A6S6VD94_9PLEO|nr:Ctr copper transporter [Pyrenophora teres f. teres]